MAIEKTINFDMDGTIADLYGVDNWLNDLINSQKVNKKNFKNLLTNRKMYDII